MSDLTPAVEAIGRMHFEGNIIPHTWYKAITYANGKPDVNAILILAEIIYWYRPTVERNEATGEIIDIRKKFKADMLQRSYQSFADQFGLTRRQCEDAVKHLTELGLIHKETRTVDTSQGRMSNVLHLEPIAEAVQRISSHVTTYKPPPSNVEASTPQRRTYTENSNKTSAKKDRRPIRAREEKKSFRPDADIDPLTR